MPVDFRCYPAQAKSCIVYCSDEMAVSVMKFRSFLMNKIKYKALFVPGLEKEHQDLTIVEYVLLTLHLNRFRNSAFFRIVFTNNLDTRFTKAIYICSH